MPKAKKRKCRGALWKRKKQVAQGSYNLRSGDRHFILTNVKSGKTIVYESPQVAHEDEWRIQRRR